jgi:hypothetical protein
MSEDAFDFSNDLEMELEYEEHVLDDLNEEEGNNLSVFLGNVNINKTLFDIGRLGNTIHNQNTVVSTNAVATITENAVSTVTPVVTLAYDGHAADGVFNNFSEVNTFKNELLISGEFSHQEIIPQYELFD